MPGCLLQPKRGAQAVWMHLSTPLSFALTKGLTVVRKHNTMTMMMIAMPEEDEKYVEAEEEGT